MPNQKPAPGRIVRYALSETDAAQVNRRRTTPARIADRIVKDQWPLGAQAHVGAEVEVGEVFPAMIVKVGAEGGVNLQVFLDGNDVFWAQAIALGEGPGTFHWPPRD